MNGAHENKTENLIVATIDAAQDIRDPLDGLVEDRKSTRLNSSH